MCKLVRVYFTSNAKVKLKWPFIAGQLSEFHYYTFSSAANFEVNCSISISGMSYTKVQLKRVWLHQRKGSEVYMEGTENMVKIVSNIS